MASVAQICLGAFFGFFQRIFKSRAVLAFLKFIGDCILTIAEFVCWATDNPYKFVLSLAFGVTVGKLI